MFLSFYLKYLFKGCPIFRSCSSFDIATVLLAFIINFLYNTWNVEWTPVSFFSIFALSLGLGTLMSALNTWLLLIELSFTLIWKGLTFLFLLPVLVIYLVANLHNMSIVFSFFRSDFRHCVSEIKNERWPDVAAHLTMSSFSQYWGDLLPMVFPEKTFACRAFHAWQTRVFSSRTQCNPCGYYWSQWVSWEFGIVVTAAMARILRGFIRRWGMPSRFGFMLWMMKVFLNFCISHAGREFEHIPDYLDKIFILPMGIFGISKTPKRR